jgi:hypothetical protein
MVRILRAELETVTGSARRGQAFSLVGVLSQVPFSFRPQHMTKRLDRAENEMALPVKFLLDWRFKTTFSQSILLNIFKFGFRGKFFFPKYCLKVLLSLIDFGLLYQAAIWVVNRLIDFSDLILVFW